MTDTRPVFYYAQGTSYGFNDAGFGLNLQINGHNIFELTANGPANRWVAGVNNDFYYWGAFPNDVFPDIIDQTLWNSKRVPYPASGIFIGPSIEIGVEWIIADILTRPVGTPFAMGGYSQGAAVMSRIYNECRQGRLVDRRHDLRAMVTFGNPMREAGHTFPGSSGYSGACDIPNDTTQGHGTFPSLESMNVFEPYVSRFARLQNTESFVWEFTMPNEVIGGVGDSQNGRFLQQATKEGLRLFPILALLGLGRMNQLWNEYGLGRITGILQDDAGLVGIPDAKTGVISYVPGGGHALYPAFPPPNADGSIPSTGDTCYQIAAKYINRVGQQIYDELHPSIPQPTAPPSYSWFSNLPVG